jgi:hypothetical protein
MGAATSVPGEYLVSPKLSRKKAKKMCEQANIQWTGLRIKEKDSMEIRPEVLPQTPEKSHLNQSYRGRGAKCINVQPKTPGADLLFDAICDDAGKISRMQVLWAASNFTNEGRLAPISFFQSKCDATRYYLFAFTAAL